MSRLVILTLAVVWLATMSNAALAEAKGGARAAKAFKLLEAKAAELSEQKSKTKSETASADKTEDTKSTTKNAWKQATFGNGCFWCTEAVFQELHGVRKVVSGYSGGRMRNPTYQQVCTGLTGHAEVIHLEYNPDVISFAKLLEVFWRTHDPTTLNRQGNDFGTQYRSAVFYHDEEQKQLAELYKNKLNTAKAFGKPVVTEIAEFKTFYVAEKKHQDFYTQNPRYGYCRAMIQPKLKKFRRVFADELARNPKNRKTNKSK